MARRKLRVFEEYRFGPRSKLVGGDRFRVVGGPIYVTTTGHTVPMYERGVFVFDKYCEQGAAKWIEAFHGDGSGRVVLWVGRTKRSNSVPGLLRRPYRVTRKLKRASKARRR